VKNLATLEKAWPEDGDHKQSLGTGDDDVLPPKVCQ
jgi:hypothetical protein